MSTRELTITKLEQVEENGRRFYRARVSAAGQTLPVHNRFGAWFGERRRAPRSRTMVMCDVQPYVAAALQAKVRPLEKKAGKS